MRDLVQSDLGRACVAEALSQAVPDKCATLLDCAAGTGGGAEFVSMKYVHLLSKADTSIKHTISLTPLPC